MLGLRPFGCLEIVDRAFRLHLSERLLVKCEKIARHRVEHLQIVGRLQLRVAMRRCVAQLMIRLRESGELRVNMFAVRSGIFVLESRALD